MDIKEAVREIIEENIGLRYCLSNRLLNLSATTRHIYPMVASKKKKDINIDSIANVLRELKDEIDAEEMCDSKQNFSIDKIAVISPLISFTYGLSQEIFPQIIQAISMILEQDNHICLVRGMKELSLIFDAQDEKLVSSTITSKQPKNEKRNLAGCVISYNEKFYCAPGIVYQISECISLQHITIYEISNTYRELILYVDEDMAESVSKVLRKEFK
jgi:hypothetical protein